MNKRSFRFSSATALVLSVGASVIACGHAAPAQTALTIAKPPPPPPPPPPGASGDGAATKTAEEPAEASEAQK
jgi:hypothetical protein